MMNGYRYGLTEEMELWRSAAVAPDEMIRDADVCAVETARQFVLPAPFGREYDGLVQQGIQPAGQVGRLHDGQPREYQHVLGEDGVVQTDADDQLDQEIEETRQRTEHVGSVFQTDAAADARRPRVDAAHVGDESDDVEDEDGEEEGNDAEQSDVATDKPVPRLQEAVVCDILGGLGGSLGVIFMGGFGGSETQHQHENAGRDNFQYNNQHRTGISRKTFRLQVLAYRERKRHCEDQDKEQESR